MTGTALDIVVENETNRSTFITFIPHCLYSDDMREKNQAKLLTYTTQNITWGPVFITN